MMTRERELLQQALDALTNCLSEHGHRCNRCDSEIDEGGKLIAALREALAAPEPEPYAHLVVIKTDAGPTKFFTAPSDPRGFPVYLAPPAAPEPEPVALESVHLTRDTRGMCVVRVNGRIAIRDNGDIIDHMATLEWFAAPPAAPAPAGWVMVPRGLLRRLIAEALTFDPSLQDKEAIEQAKQLAASPAAPAAPVVPLTDEQLAKIAVEDEFLLYCDQDSFNEIARAIEAAHGITGASK